MEELLHPLRVTVTVFPWLWEALPPLISDYLRTILQPRPQQQLPSAWAVSPQPLHLLVV